MYISFLLIDSMIVFFDSILFINYNNNIFISFMCKFCNMFVIFMNIFFCINYYKNNI